MKIVRYVPDVQTLTRLKTKPEPWMHVAIDRLRSIKTNTLNPCYAVVFVWDTREILEIAIIDAAAEHAIKSMPNAVDNNKPLKGKDKDNAAFTISAKMLNTTFVLFITSSVTMEDYYTRHYDNKASLDQAFKNMTIINNRLAEAGSNLKWTPKTINHGR